MNNAQIGDKILKYDNEQTTEINRILNMIYPVESIYISTSDQNPSSIFGGTWERFANGRTLVGVDTTQTEFNEVGKTGGEKTHKLSVDEMPSHYHRQTYSGDSGNHSYTPSNIVLTGISRGTANGQNTQNEGGDKEHNNLQPYITVYMWLRTA